MTAGEIAPDEPRQRRRPKHGIARFIRDIVIILLVAILISFLLKTFVVRSFYIPSASMTNTLQINDRIVVNELVPRVAALHRGDVVVFTDPGGWLGEEIPPAPSNPIAYSVQSFLTFIGLGTLDSNNHLVKRVVGLPGDKVSCCNAFGQLEINGIPIKEPYIIVPSDQPADSSTYSVTVPKGELWVLGDNRYQSDDSAAHFRSHDATAFVPVDDVVGQAFAITWPISRWSNLSNYPEVFRGTDLEN